MTRPVPEPGPSGCRVAIVGLGAVGSFVAGYLGRLGSILHFVLVDPDRYEARSVGSQDIDPADVGKTKVGVQARRLGRLCPQAHIVTLPFDVRSIPMGHLKGDAIFSCVDSRAARQAINTLAWRLGVPWIDSGIDAGALLARVRVFRPGDRQSCGECAWDDQDYALIEQAYPCPGGSGSPHRTGAPAPLAALAASIQALEGRKVLAGEWDQALVGREVLIDAQAHRQYVSGYRPNRSCRFDHRRWNLHRLDCGPRDLTLGEAFELGRGGSGPDVGLRMELEYQRFTHKLTCLGCRRSVPVVRLVRTVSGRIGSCTVCGSDLVSAGFDITPGLSSAALTPAERALSLKQVGLGPGDIYSIRGPDRSLEFEIPLAS